MAQGGRVQAYTPSASSSRTFDSAMVVTASDDEVCASHWSLKQGNPVCDWAGMARGNQGSTEVLRTWTQRLVHRQVGDLQGPIQLSWHAPTPVNLSIRLRLSPVNPHRILLDVVPDPGQLPPKHATLEVLWSSDGDRGRLGLELLDGRISQTLPALPSRTALTFRPPEGWGITLSPHRVLGSATGRVSARTVRILRTEVGHPAFDVVQDDTNQATQPHPRTDRLQGPHAGWAAALGLADLLPLPFLQALSDLSSTGHTRHDVHRALEQADPIGQRAASVPPLDRSWGWPFAVLGLREDTPLTQVERAYELSSFSGGDHQLLTALVQHADAATLAVAERWTDISPGDVPHLPELRSALHVSPPGAIHLPAPHDAAWREVVAAWRDTVARPTPQKVRAWIRTADETWSQTRHAVASDLRDAARRLADLPRAPGDVLPAHVRPRALTEAADELQQAPRSQAPQALQTVHEALSEASISTFRQTLRTEETRRTQQLQDTFQALVANVSLDDADKQTAMERMLGVDTWQRRHAQVHERFLRCRDQLAAAPPAVLADLPQDLVELVQSDTAVVAVTVAGLAPEARARASQGIQEAVRQAHRVGVALDPGSSTDLGDLVATYHKIRVASQQHVDERERSAARLADLLPLEPGESPIQLLLRVEAQGHPLLDEQVDDLLQAVQLWADDTLLSGTPLEIPAPPESTADIVVWISTAAERLQACTRQVLTLQRCPDPLVRAVEGGCITRTSDRVARLANSVRLTDAWTELNLVLGRYNPPFAGLAFLPHVTPAELGLWRVPQALHAALQPESLVRPEDLSTLREQVLDAARAHVGGQQAIHRQIPSDLHRLAAGTFYERWQRAEPLLFGQGASAPQPALRPADAWNRLLDVWAGLDMVPAPLGWLVPPYRRHAPSLPTDHLRGLLEVHHLLPTEPS